MSKPIVFCFCLFGWVKLHPPCTEKVTVSTQNNFVSIVITKIEMKKTQKLKSTPVPFIVRCIFKINFLTHLVQKKWLRVHRTTLWASASHTKVWLESEFWPKIWFLQFLRSLLLYFVFFNIPSLIVSCIFKIN